MTPPPPPPDDTAREPRGEPSWNPLRRLRAAFGADEPEPQLRPADPSGFDWLEQPAPAEAAPAQPALADPAQPGQAAPAQADPAQPAPAQIDPAQADPAQTDPAPAPPMAPEAPAPSAAQAAHHAPAPPPPGGIAGRDPDGMLVLGGGPAAPAPPERPLANGGLCTECGGTVDPDGYCENCGAKAADPSHHYRITVTPWLAGVCDRGVKHPGNEDALAIRGGEAPTGQRAALVVCDGVSSAPNSAQASAAAVEAAAEVLATSRAQGVGGVTSALAGALGLRLTAAVDAAADAVRAVAREVAAPPGGGPSCTVVAAVVEDGAAVIGNVGDSRAYWFGDDGASACLTQDDSWAAEQIRAGASRQEAETGPHAHTITRWLGEDCPDHAPSLTTLEVARPGWLLLCSDGLWNYASPAPALAEVFRAQAAAVPAAQREREPAAALAAALVEWAKAQGGHDNITVALAYLLAAEDDVPSQATADHAVPPSQPTSQPASQPTSEPTGEGV